MEDRVNLPLSGNLEVEGCLGDDFFNFKETGLSYLELFGTIHVEIGGFEPDFILHLPRGEFRGYLFPHLLLGNLVGGLGVIAGGS